MSLLNYAIKRERALYKGIPVTVYRLRERNRYLEMNKGELVDKSLLNKLGQKKT